MSQTVATICKSPTKPWFPRHQIQQVSSCPLTSQRHGPLVLPLVLPPLYTVYTPHAILLLLLNINIYIYIYYILISACRCCILNSRSVPPVNAPASVLPTFCEQTSIPRPWQQSVSNGSGQINGTGIPKPEMRWTCVKISWNESLLRFFMEFWIVLGYGWFNGSIFLPPKKPHLNGRAQGGHPQGRRANHHVHLTWQKPRILTVLVMLTWLGYIDGIHGTPYMAAPWIRHGLCQFISVSIVYPELWSFDDPQ